MMTKVVKSQPPLEFACRAVKLFSQLEHLSVPFAMVFIAFAAVPKRHEFTHFEAWVLLFRQFVKV